MAPKRRPAMVWLTGRLDRLMSFEQAWLRSSRMRYTLLGRDARICLRWAATKSAMSKCNLHEHRLTTLASSSSGEVQCWQVQDPSDTVPAAVEASTAGPRMGEPCEWNA